MGGMRVSPRAQHVRARVQCVRGSTALRQLVQLTQLLADGCSASDYSKKALAFLVNINPNLPQPYESKDVATYLIQLMPKSLRESGRLIKTELIAAGRLEDHMYVISKCRELVQEEQKGSSHLTFTNNVEL